MNGINREKAPYVAAALDRQRRVPAAEDLPGQFEEAFIRTSDNLYCIGAP